ncbi:MAG: carbohydrate kinase [Rhodobacteraceae bacterium]|nr:carbohydrate kinase [Paracoccaceae bacterium]
MDKRNHIAVFDLGKTNQKVVLIDGKNLIPIDSRKAPNSVLQGLYPHLDTTSQWRFLCDCLSDFEQDHGVDGVAITTHGATIALVAGDRLALPVLDYEFEMPPSVDEAYNGLRPPFDETLSPRLPGGLNIGAQLHFLQTKFPKEFARTDYILTYPQYWSFRLTGQARSEATSLGCHTDLWQPKTGQFSSLVGRMLPKTLFPPIAKASDVFALSSAAAQATGLRPGIPVTCGIHDSNASLVPWLNSGHPLSVVSSGTWTIVMSLGVSPGVMDAGRDMLANVDALGRPTPTARFMGGRDHDLLTKGCDGAASFSDIATVISKGIFIMPGRVPGVGPFPQARGGWRGTPPVGMAEKLASATLYLALMTQTCLDLIGMGQHIILEGPLAGNLPFARCLSALTGVAVHVSSDATGTATGAALLLLEADQDPHLGPAVAPADLPGLSIYAEIWRDHAQRAR